MMGTMEKKCYKLLDKMWKIYHEHGGYQYNDEMLIQLQGCQEEMSESETEKDFTYTYDQLYETHHWFKLVKTAKLAMDKVESSNLIYC